MSHLIATTIALLISCFTIAQEMSAHATIGGHSYTASVLPDLLIEDSKGTVVYRAPDDDFTGVMFKDFNLDGYKDVYVEHGGNIPQRYSLFIFLPQKKHLLRWIAF